MFKFKVGDHIKLAKPIPHFSWAQSPKNYNGTIVQINPETDRPYIVDCLGVLVALSEDYLEYAIGDVAVKEKAVKNILFLE